MVGRPRQFDVDQALDAAMQAFWAKGYQATSLADLMAVTGLHKGSLYQTFGDKHTLFIRALKRYLEDMRRQKDEVLRTAATPLDGIRNVLHRILDIANSDSECPKGCMAINSLVELAPHDDEVKQVMGDHQRRMRESLEKTVSDAQAAGQVDKRRPATLITALLVTFMAGLGTTMRGQLNKAKAHELLDAYLEAIL